MRYTRSLRLPVEPQAAGAMMEMVAADDRVDRRMHLNTADFRAAKLLLIVDMMDVVIFDNGKYTAQVSDDTGLLAIMDSAAADDMASDLLLDPAFPLRLADCIALRLRAVLGQLQRPFIFIVGLEILTQRNTAAF